MIGIHAERVALYAHRRAAILRGSEAVESGLYACVDMADAKTARELGAAFGRYSAAWIAVLGAVATERLCDARLRQLADSASR